MALDIAPRFSPYSRARTMVDGATSWFAGNDILDSPRGHAATGEGGRHTRHGATRRTVRATQPADQSLHRVITAGNSCQPRGTRVHFVVERLSASQLADVLLCNWYPTTMLPWRGHRRVSRYWPSFNGANRPC